MGNEKTENTPQKSEVGFERVVMQREIKFRAWNGNGMTYFNLNHTGLRGLVKIMQYVGLRDKNGVEIFEGDIVEDNVGRIWVVAFDKDEIAFGFRYRGNTHPSDFAVLSRFIKVQLPFQIIGNIYENPELLKVA